MTNEERQQAQERQRLIALHRVQVEAGVIPADSPDTFVRPTEDDALVDGLPWWFGGTERYRPTPEALRSFSRPTVAE